MPDESIDRADALPDEPAPPPARAGGSLSDVVCDSQGYGEAAQAAWSAERDELLACALETNATSCILNVSVWHGKPRYGGGPLPGRSAVIGTPGEGVSKAAVECLTVVAARMLNQLSPAEIPARADCRAHFERG